MVREGAFVDSGIIFSCQSNFVSMMPGKPAPVIVGFIHSDAVNPGLEAAIALERADFPENLKENLLGDVGGIGRIVHQPVNQIVNRLLEAADQRFISFFGARAQGCQQGMILLAR